MFTLNIVKTIECVTKEINLNNLLNFSELGFHKFIVEIMNDLSRDIDEVAAKLFTENMIFDVRDEQDIGNKIVSLAKIIFIVARTHIIYCLYASIIGFINLKSLKPIKHRKRNIKFLFLSSTDHHYNLGLMYNKLKNVSLHLFLPSEALLKKVGRAFFFGECGGLSPKIPPISVIVKMIRYIFSKGVLLQAVINRIRGDEKYYNFHKKLYIMLVHKAWAENVVNRIVDCCSTVVVILENDACGKMLALAEELGKRKIKCVHVQHGSFVWSDIEFIPPLCQFFLCCSEREKEIQIRNGYNPENIFVYGQPLQTMDDARKSKRISGRGSYQFDIVVLGSRGARFRQKKQASLLNVINEFYPDLSVYFRHDPCIDKCDKNIWEKEVKNITISKNKDLIEDIQMGEIVIIFSQDAMISCLRCHKKSIFCVDYKEDNIKSFGFLKERKSLRFADTPLKLSDAIQDFLCVYEDDIVNNYDDDFIDYNFGVSDIDKVQNNVANALNAIYFRG